LSSKQDSAVVCKDITKTYGHGSNAVLALRGVNLTVYQREVLIITGPSGSGKTTLISIIGGILNPDGGECHINSHNLTTLSDEEKTAFRAHNVGFIFQAFNLIPMFTTVENVSIPLVLLGIPREDAAKKSTDLLIRVGLGDKLNAFPAELSGGQQQRVAIARSCIHKPRLIVCDEPTSALDHATGIKVMETLRQITLEDDGTLIIVTHDTRIHEFADRIVQMEDGKIINGG
jgi:putative ABC transport system ATP-binding protein